LLREWYEYCSNPTGNSEIYRSESILEVPNWIVTNDEFRGFQSEDEEY
jgi:hypothetical protein